GAPRRGEAALRLLHRRPPLPARRDPRDVVRLQRRRREHRRHAARASRALEAVGCGGRLADAPARLLHEDRRRPAPPPYRRADVDRRQPRRRNSVRARVHGSGARATRRARRRRRLRERLGRAPDRRGHAARRSHVRAPGRRPHRLPRARRARVVGRARDAAIGSFGSPRPRRALMEFGVTVLPDPPFSRWLELIQLAERHGFQYAWTYDSHVLWQESIPMLAVAARETSKIKLGHFLTNPATREPTVLASAYATLHDLSDGRMVMGVGRGDSAVRYIGRQPMKVAEFEKALAMIHEFMNGREVTWNDK